MSSLIEQLSTRFSSAEKMTIEVPEWGMNGEGEPFKVYFSAWTLHDERSIKRFINDENPEGFAYVVVKKAQDINGKRLFDDGDVKRLMRNTEAHIIKRIAMEIIGSTISVEDAMGN